MRISIRHSRIPELFAENASVAVGIGATTDILVVPIPNNCAMRLKKFGNYLGTVAAWGSITWRFKHNGIPLAPYDAVRDQIGYAAQREQIRELELSSGVFSIDAVNAFGAIVNVGVSLEWELLYKE